MTVNKRPTRTDLLRVIGRLQSLVEAAKSTNHDRNPYGRAQSEGALNTAIRLCQDVTMNEHSEDIEPTGKGWGDDRRDNDWKNCH